ncbi:MAG: response regulator [Campylobacteraceae bacterium]|nr:response regulator [Campylobacteraceae bacterium]
MNYNIDKFKNLKIIYVEDELDLQKVVVSFLFDIVNRIDYFSNGLEALDAFSENEYDLIITDINMPRLNGLELIKKIRLKNKDIPIIITTAYDDPNYIEEIKNLGASSYVLKPLDFSELIDTININIK